VFWDMQTTCQPPVLAVNCDRASCPTLPLYHVTELCQQKNAMKNILFCG